MLTDDGELFYRRLMSAVDDFGRLEADPATLRPRLFPRALDRWPPSRVSAALTDVSTPRSDDGHVPVIVWRDESTGKMYLQINKFQQRVRAEKSKYPSPDGKMTVIWPSDDGPPHASRARTTPSPSPTSSSTAGGSGGADISALIPCTARAPLPGGPRFEEWLRAWPRCGDPDGACREWLSRVTVADEEAVFGARDRYLRSDEVSRGVVMEPKRFIREQADGNWRGKWPAKTNGRVDALESRRNEKPREFTEAEIAAMAADDDPRLREIAEQIRNERQAS